jgi:hypothetical protein
VRTAADPQESVLAEVQQAAVVAEMPGEERGEDGGILAVAAAVDDRSLGQSISSLASKPSYDQS